MSKVKDMEQAVEQQPLLGAPAHGVPVNVSAQKLAPRQWRYQWYNIFGDGSGSDVAACCLAWKVPCIAWGWNQSRGLQFSFWKELCRFVALTVGVFLVAHVACCALIMTFCPEAVLDDFNDRPRGPHMGGPHGMDDHHGGPHMHGHGPDGPDFDDGPEECLARIAPAYLGLFAALVAACVCVALFLGRRRTALRERYGIEGSTKEDTLLYLCCGPCALTQETRTLMHEQVHDGVWYGALPGVQAPVPASMTA